MGIVSEKKFLTEEEKNTLKDIQQSTQVLILELGEIEMIKIQLEERYQNAKRRLFETSNQEKEFTQSLFDKYGKINLNPETGEFTKLD
jgi:hypothetical protein